MTPEYHFIRAIGFAGLAWWISFWALTKWESEEEEDTDSDALKKSIRDTARLSLIPALFAFMAAL